MNDKALIIFAKNAVEGKVKTRLAVDLGNAATLSFYKNLLKICKKSTHKLQIDKFLFYSDFIDNEDCFNNEIYHKRIQSKSTDLGEKMIRAFDDIFSLNYKKCIIIGSDCPYIDSNIIKKAFHKLDDNDVVIGPALDGGFYLLGVKCVDYLLFENIVWSTNKVTNVLSNNLKNKRLKFEFLTFLNDIDDYNSYKKFIKNHKTYELQ